MTYARVHSVYCLIHYRRLHCTDYLRGDSMLLGGTNFDLHYCLFNIDEKRPSIWNLLLFSSCTKLVWNHDPKTEVCTKPWPLCTVTPTVSRCNVWTEPGWLFYNALTMSCINTQHLHFLSLFLWTDERFSVNPFHETLSENVLFTRSLKEASWKSFFISTWSNSQT